MYFIRYLYRYLYCIPVLFSILLEFINASNELFVLFPSAFFWNATNVVYVTPLLTARDHVDVGLLVEEEQGKNPRRKVFSEQQSRRPTMQTSIFNVKLPADSAARRYYVTVTLAGHTEFHGHVNGASDVATIFLQTDKSFYQPDETVAIRALPITNNGELYVGDVEFQLLDPNGFRIFNKTLSADASRGAAFIETDFALPNHVRFGEWRVVASAGNSFWRAIRPIRVQEYVLPKYHIFMSIVESEESPFIVSATVMARFANGMQLSGDVFFGCAPLSDRGDEVDKVPAVATELPAADALFPLRQNIGKGGVNNGQWTGRLNLTECIRAQLPAVDRMQWTAHASRRQHQTDERPARQPPVSWTSGGTTRLLLTAEVHERGTFLASVAAVEFDPLAAGFDIVPLRPAYTQHQQTVAVYLRPSAGNHGTSGEALTARTVELVAQCVSADSAANGLNRSLGNHQLGTVVEVPVDLRCTVLFIKGRTKFTDGGVSPADRRRFYYSREERLVVPALFGVDFFHFHLIRIVNTVAANALKVKFHDGETLHAVVPPNRGLNYFVICNSRNVAAAAAVPFDGRINVSVEAARMHGTCVLYVYGMEKQILFADMHLFFVADRALCPDDYTLESSKRNASVFEDVELRLKAPAGSLASLHAYDGRLDALAAQWRRGVAAGASPPVAESPNQLWTFAEFMAPVQHSDFAFPANLLPMDKLNRHLKTSCALAGRQTPQCQPRPDPPTVSLMSDVCAREIVRVCNEHANAMPLLSGLQDRHSHPVVDIAGFGNAHLQHPPQNLMTRSEPQADASPGLLAVSRANADAAVSDQETALRYYFPEVWLFNSYVIGPNNETTVRTKTPHSVTNWRLGVQFWTRGRLAVCEAPHRTLFALKLVFMDVNMPLHVYENETVQVRVTVSANHFEGPSTNLAVCFGGLSPAVCGDVGRNGTLGEIDYTRIILSADQRVQVKKFYVRFLRAGYHNITFELRGESGLPGGDWHCRDEEAHLYDRISRRVRVDERVDLEEHYRQVIVYQTKRILPQDRPAPLPSAGSEVTLAGIGEHHTGVVQRVSVPDIIQYSQSYRGVDDSLLTEINVNSLEKVYSMQLEFSKFELSLPLSLATALQRTAASAARLSPLQADASPRQKWSKKRYRNTYRDQRAVADSATKHSLPAMLRTLAAATYELKSLNDYRAQLANEIEKRKYVIGNLLSELLTYSDCAAADNEMCGFGEFGRPKHPGQRSPLLSAMATSLLCEQNAPPEFVCGPSRFLADIVRQLNVSGRHAEIDLGYSTQLRFETYQEKVLFMQCLLVRVVLDCGMYQCIQAEKSAWQDLHRDFFAFDERHVRDVRLEAALAYVSTPSTRQLMRLRLAGKGKIDRLPFWSATADRRPAVDLLETNIIKSENILTNSLALLAYSASRQLYDYYRNQFDFDALAGWLIEQQSASGLYENAIDTYFGCRALYSYRITQSSVGFESRKIYANLTSDSLAGGQRQFSNRELPFSLSMPPSTGHVMLRTRGDGRLLVGVRVLSGRRRRSKRDPSDNYPVTIRMTQARVAATNVINQTVTLLAHSAMLKYLEVEHGVFTGFTTQPSSIVIRSDTARFYYEPEVSTSAVHFAIENVQKDEPITYTLMLTEPEDSYSPNDLAPIAISAIHHTVVGRLIVLPTSLSFIETAQSNASTSTRNDQVTVLSGSEDFADGVEHPPRYRLRDSSFGLPSERRRNFEKNKAMVASRRRRAVYFEHRQRRAAAPQPLQFSNGAALSVSSSDAPAGALRYQLGGSVHIRQAPSNAHDGLTAANLQSSTDELVETVCLTNGACTCAEMTCQMQCSNCSALTFRSLCAELLRPTRFSVIFRITERRIAEIGRARYTVFDVKIIDWFGGSSSIDALSVWIRDCNPECIRLTDATVVAKPRFLLIGDWRGLFSEGINNPSPDNDDDDSDFTGGVSRLGDDEHSSGRRRRTVAGKKRRARDSVLRSHYVVRENDRLARSTDCWPLFGRLQDEQCWTKDEL